jgi:hypothetical protein
MPTQKVELRINDELACCTLPWCVKTGNESRGMADGSWLMALGSWLMTDVKSEIRNPQSEIPNPKSAIHDSESKKIIKLSIERVEIISYID